MYDAPSPAPSHRRGVLRGLDQSSVMGAELITATLTWAALGWFVDRWLGTGPWFLAIGALVGNAASIYLIWLRAARMDADEARDRSAASRAATEAATEAASEAASEAPRVTQEGL